MIASQLWWHLARSSGLIAWAVLAAAMLWGLLISTRVLGRRPSRPWLVEMHRWLSSIALLLIALHLVALYADSFVEFTPADLLVPMASEWRPGAVALGIVALYLLVAVEVTSLAIDRLPRAVWHAVHLTSFAAFAASTAHGLMAGTDAGNPLVRIGLVVGVAEVVFVAAVRIVYRRQSWRSA